MKNKSLFIALFSCLLAPLSAQTSDLPFKGGAASKWNTYGYDGHGRLSQQTHASGKTTTYTYAGNSITETKNYNFYLLQKINYI